MNDPAEIRRRRVYFIALVALFLLVELTALPWRARVVAAVRHWRHAESATAVPVHMERMDVTPAWTDSFGDGTPDFLRLTDPVDRAAFRRWFTVIADYQAIRSRTEVPAEITDCASLLRYAYREALKRHDAAWFEETGMQVEAPPGEIHEWNYPHTPLAAGLFRVLPGAFEPTDATDGTFAQFADAKTLVERNAHFVSRDVRQAEPGDLLFYRQFGQSSPWHSMIVVETGPEARVVYDTGPDHGQPGELRRVSLADLLDHPEPQWRPLPGNPNFLGVYRWNILRGNE